MIEFFRGWKRKVGCVTLLTACIFAAGWVRSFTSTDSIQWDLRAIGFAIVSMNGIVALAFGTLGEQLEWTFPEIGSGGFSSFEEQSANIDWWWNLAGVRFGCEKNFVPPAILCVIASPYPLVTLPLTLLSAWLLLSKHRNLPTTTISEPSYDEVT